MLESVHGDPPIEEQRNMLADAIESAVKKAGLIRPDINPTGPQLLMFLDDLVTYHLELVNEKFTCSKCSNKNAMSVPISE